MGGSSNDLYFSHPFSGRRHRTNNAQRRRAQTEAALIEYARQIRDEEEEKSRIEEMALLERQYLHQKKLEEEAQRRRSERETIRQYRLEEEAKRRRGLWLRELQKESERQQMMERMQDINEERPDAHQFKHSQIPMRNPLYSDLDSNQPLTFEESGLMKKLKNRKGKVIRNAGLLRKISEEPESVYLSDEDNYDGKSYDNMVVNDLNGNTNAGKRITKTKSKVLIGEVEDASDDEMNHSSRVWCNRRPNVGQWMEPVESQ